MMIRNLVAGLILVLPTFAFAADDGALEARIEKKVVVQHQDTVQHARPGLRRPSGSQSQRNSDPAMGASPMSSTSRATAGISKSKAVAQKKKLAAKPKAAAPHR